ncbi:MAG: hypothetical protein E6G14_02210 [Actinobacteria bacterium]|nr:MAG: hypothetical protein E6G14_02210 [Actinomycetota bacterium]
MPEPPGETTFDDLRTQLAAPAPSLAGASAAALTAAMAAALVTMIGRASSDWQQGEQTARDASELGDRLVALAAEDAHVFGRVLEVVRASGLSDTERNERLGQALLDASEPAVAIAEAAADVVRLATQAEANGRASMKPDAAAASTLARAAVTSAALAIEANLPASPQPSDEVRAASLRQRARRATSRAQIAAPSSA